MSYQCGDAIEEKILLLAPTFNELTLAPNFVKALFVANEQVPRNADVLLLFQGLGPEEVLCC